MDLRFSGNNVHRHLRLPVGTLAQVCLSIAATETLQTSSKFGIIMRFIEMVKTL